MPGGKEHWNGSNYKRHALFEWKDNEYIEKLVKGLKDND